MSLPLRIPHVIIGGGIAGIYIAMQLWERKEPFIILEKSTKPHSKLESTKEDGVVLEMGASVFHTRQYNLLRLLNFFDLSTEIEPLPIGRTKFVYFDQDSSKVQKIFKKLKANLHHQSETLKGLDSLMTVEQLAVETLSAPEYDFLINCWDCWWEICDMNAAMMFQSEDMEGRICKLRCGLKELIKRAWVFFHDHILTDCEVVTVEQFTGNTIHSEYQIVASKHQQRIRLVTEHPYVCVSLEQIPEIEWKGKVLHQQIQRMLSLGETRSSMRYYIILKKELHIPFRYVIGEVIGHWWVQITSKIFMLYCDGQHADELNSMDDDTIIANWTVNLKRLFIEDISVLEVKRVIRGYWPHAFTILTPEYYSPTANLVVDSLPFVCTALPFADNQAWMEGHLLNIE